MIGQYLLKSRSTGKFLGTDSRGVFILVNNESLAARFCEEHASLVACGAAGFFDMGFRVIEDRAQA